MRDEIVKRLEAVVERVAEKIAPGFFDFALHDGDAVVEELLDIRRNLREQREVSGDVETANHYGESGAAKNVRKVGGARELVGLHAGETDDRFRGFVALRFANALDWNFVHGFVEDVDYHVHRIAEAFLGNEVFRQTCEASKRVAGQNSTKVADDVTVIVIL